jgi:type VI secretion system secreted protein VgrG
MPILPANLERFFFDVSSADEELRVVSFGATEGISQLFSVDLELVVEDNELDFEQFIGQAGVLTVQEYDDEEPRYFYGIISRFEQGDSGLHFTTYNATLVPKIWYLMHRHNCRIFQQKSVRDIVKKILDELGIAGDEYRFVLQNQPPERDYCVQYRESDFDFFSRLLEEEGIFYFFEHQDDKHILVMGDNSAAHLPIPGESEVIFHEPHPGQVVDEPHIYSFSYTEEVLPGKVSLKDYNFKKPALNLKGEKTANIDTKLEIYDYPGKFDEPERGQYFAKVRLEEYQAVKKVGSGATTCSNFAAGFYFTMKKYLRRDFNKKYLITQHQLAGSQPQDDGACGGSSSFSSSFECSPFETPYRPDKVTSKPVVEGSQTAFVVGPSGEEIYTDEHGRIKVQFHWDREGQMNENSSCWIRVSQLWAGRSWGAMYIPRIGQEVIVDFLEGDPDRPIITGRVYHGTNKPPYPLPEEKTKSTIKSNSSLGGDGSNEIRFEDSKGNEEVYLQAEKDWNTLVKNDKTQHIQHDETLTVDNDRTRTVHHDENVTIYNDRTKTVGVNHSETIGADKSIQVGANHDENIGANMSLTVKQNYTTTITKCDHKLIVEGKKTGHQTVRVKKGNRSIDARGDETYRVKKKRRVEVKGDETHTNKGKFTHKVTKDYVLEVKGNLTIKANKIKIESTAGSLNLKAKTELKSEAGTQLINKAKTALHNKAGTSMTNDAKLKLTNKAGVSLTNEAKMLTNKGSAMQNVKASGALIIKGSMVVIN